MVRAAFLADCHCGNHKSFGGPLVAGVNSRCAETVDTFKRALETAGKEGCEVVFVLGDLLDTSRPTPQVLTAVAKAIRSTTARGGPEVWLLAGNHDLSSDAPGDHGLGPLQFVDGVTVVSEPCVRWLNDYAAAVLCVPFAPQQTGESMLIEAGKLVAEAVSDFRRVDQGPLPPMLLAAHLGIIDELTPHFLRNSPGAITATRLRQWCKANGVRVALAGDWHQRRQWKDLPEEPIAMQVGALCPTGWDNPGQQGYGTLALWTGSALDYLEIPGPRFFKVDSAAEAVKAAGKARAAGCNPRIMVEADLADASALALVGQAGIVAVTQAAGTAGKDAARAAADAARSALTLDEALAAYVSEMALESDEQREAVLRAATAYLEL